MSLTIATFNLRSRSFTETGEDTGTRAWGARLDAAADYVIRSGASLVALQEVDFFPAPRQSQELAARLYDLTGRSWARLEDTSRPGSFIYDSSVVTVLAGGDAAHSERVDPNFTGARHCTWARFAATGLTDPFWVVRTHFPITSSAPPEQRPSMYQQAATILANRADQLQADGSRALIMGDFNHHQLPHTTLATRGYRDVRTMAPASNSILRSFNAWDPNMAGRQDGTWIDGIFLSDRWEAAASGLVVKFADAFGLPVATPMPSDHFPVMATIFEVAGDGPGPGPGPEPVPLSTDPRPQLLAGNLVTGAIVRDLSSMVSACSWSVGLNVAGRIEAAIPLAHLPKRDRRELRAMFEETDTYLAVTTGPHVIEAGPIQPIDACTSSSSRAGVQVLARGIRSVFEDRTVVKAEVVHDVIDGVIDDGTSVQASTLVYTGLSLGTIAKRIVQNSLLMPGGRLPIVFRDDEAGTDERTYDGFRLLNLAQELDELSNADRGPDIELRPRFNADGSGIEWQMLTGTTADPLLHQPGGDWVYDFTTARGPVADLDSRSDSSKRTNFAWTTGSGQDTALRVSPRSNNADWERGYTLRESVSSHPSVETWAEIHRLGEARLRQGSRPRTTWSATLRPESPPLGLFRPGDWSRVHLEDHLWIPDGQYRVRIAGFSGSWVTPLVEITFLPTLEAR